MELFAHSKAVRLKSRHDKYLYADEDELHVTQDRNGSSPNARWTVEPVPGGAIRLRSRYGRYLAASGDAFLLGMTGRKVLQAAPAPGGRPDASVEWEPVRDGFQARLKSRVGSGRGGESKYLRANGGVPPWRNSVTHDAPHRTNAQDWVLWDVEIVQVLTPGPATPGPGLDHAESAPASVLAPESPPPPKLRPAPTPQEAHHRPTKSYPAPPPPHPEYAPPPVPPTTARPEPKLSKLEGSQTFNPSLKIGAETPFIRREGPGFLSHIQLENDIKGHKKLKLATGEEAFAPRSQTVRRGLQLVVDDMNRLGVC